MTGNVLAKCLTSNAATDAVGTVHRGAKIPDLLGWILFYC